MSDRDYLYGHGSLARSCEVCDLEDLLDAVQEALTWAEAPVRYDGGYLSLAERVRWLHLRGRDRHRERDEARAEVRRLREELQGMVAESSWDELADEMTEVEAENGRLRAERAVMLDVIRAADALARRADRTDPLWAMPQIMADLEAALDRFDDLPGDAA